ncbi:MAG: alkaline phosphatase family protein, partial [Candidatus Bipolaricaulota bacterium]|nr:alkaline phosphatase family protein [Candidatus Bipolaricaulota bacterium]
MGQAKGIEARLRSRTFDGLPAGKAVVPDYLEYSICAVPGLVRTLFHEPGGAEGHLYAAVASAVRGPVDRVILLVIDGLGFYHLASLLERFPDLYLHSLIERGAFVPITSVFPSTTVSALTTFSTGLTPQEHGMVGYRLYLRETSSITNMIRLSLLGSGLSNLLYGASDQLHPSTNLSDMLVTARHVVQRAAGKVFVHLYWSETDSIAHVHGPRTEEFTAELRAVDAALGRELGESRGAVLVITSDHGFVTMERQDYTRIDEDPLLMRDLVLPPVGEPRASYLFVREGRRRAVADRIAERFAGDLVCLDSHEALERGLFGRGD